MSETRGRRKSGGGRSARQASRANDTVKVPAFITRQLNPFEVLDDLLKSSTKQAWSS